MTSQPETIFPLAQKILIRGCAEHKKAGLGCAADYVAHYVDGLVPFDSEAYFFGGPNNDGGDWIGFRHASGWRIEVAHLSKRFIDDGIPLKRGELAFLTGNTGKLTTGPHLHLQIFDPAGNRVDPETYQWSSPINPIDMAIEKVVAAQKKKIEDLTNGAVAAAFDPKAHDGKGATYLIRNSKKRELPVVEVLNALLVPTIATDVLKDIPNA